VGGSNTQNDIGPVDTSDDGSMIKQVTQTEYLNTIKTKKKENITPETCAQVMLSVIPGMSTDTAKVVLDVMGQGTLTGLIAGLTANGDAEIKEKKKALAAIQVKPGRKLGPAMAEKLWDYLFGVVSK
jgi:uncharacterized protein YpuA (DUF1002 family)